MPVGLGDVQPGQAAELVRAPPVGGVDTRRLLHGQMCLLDGDAGELVALVSGGKIFQEQDELGVVRIDFRVIAVRHPDLEFVGDVLVEADFAHVVQFAAAGGAALRAVRGDLGDDARRPPPASV